jgi:hypothetical protein
MRRLCSGRATCCTFRQSTGTMFAPSRRPFQSIFGSSESMHGDSVRIDGGYGPLVLLWRRVVTGFSIDSMTTALVPGTTG